MVVGPEVVSGSTRLKAGTAQKLVLNAISTATMIRLGRTYAGLMVGVAPENAKLRERARRNVVIASGRSEEDVDEALAAAEGDARVALVALLAGVDPATARERLDGAGGSVQRRARSEDMRLDVQAALVRGELVPGDVEIEDGVIVDVGLAGGTRGRIAVPGFVDLQVNGYGGVDFLSASTLDYDTAGSALLEGGVTAYQPTFITAPESGDARRAAGDAGERLVPARRRRARRGPVPLARAARHASARAPARSRSRAARPAARRRPRHGVHARARACRAPTR